MKKLLVLPLFLATVFLFAKTAAASEGTFELRSTESAYNYKCFAASLQMQNLNYKILYSCRNIIFPIDETIYTYVLWANPVNAGKPTKLGSIGLGRGEFTINTAFASLFITAEQNAGVKEPAGKVVMKGSIKPVAFLEKDVQAEEEEEKETEKAEETKEAEEEESASEVQKSSVRDRLITGLKRAGLASGLALVAILGLVFVLTRPR